MAKSVDINLGLPCNNRCVFCSNGDTSKKKRVWMKPEDAEGEVDRRWAEGLRALGWIGGEPTLYPHLKRLVAYASELGFERIGICTNGARISDRDFLQGLVEAGLTRVAFSIHSHRAALEDAITRRSGSFDNKIQAIENLVEVQRAGGLADNFSLNAVLHGQNLDELVPMVAFFVDLGVGDIRFNFIRPENEAVGNRRWVPRLERVGPRLVELVAANEARFGIHITFADIPACRLPWELLSNPSLRRKYAGERRDADTEVTLYTPHKSGKVERFNWREQRTAHLKAQLESCRDCPIAEGCEGIWQRYLDIYGPDEFAQGPGFIRACLASR